MLDDKTRALLGDRAAQERLTAAGVLPLTWRPDFTGKGQAMMDMAWCVWDLAPRGTTYFLPLEKPNAEEMEMLEGME